MADEFVASADRRPVDPPPVVELRVYEGEDNNLKDITISFHNVNFFLFATLEARPIAHGRIHTPGPPSVAVLNGCNVAGVNYLERPSPAGYFIFPDLSVRHEGFYRLTFGLYEQVKDPNDADPERPFPNPADSIARSDVPGPPQMHNSSVQRLEVKSEEFQVYSAKKFPGLDRSTGLSIGLSDQGCRVRIRRDVRMRKRPKPKAIPEGPYGADAMRGRYGTPSNVPTPSSHDRPRSMSHSSRDGSQYGDHRRLSIHSGDVYSNPPPTAPLGHSTSLPGSSFAVPTTPSSALPPAHYPQPHYASTVGVPTTSPGSTNRIQDYMSKPAHYQPYEHRSSDASSYAPSEAGSRRSSEAYNHYTYTPARQPSIVADPAETRLPPVSDLLRESDARQGEFQPPKRSYSPSRYGLQSLKSGMRPSQDMYEDNEPPSFPGILEYKRANGGLSQAPMDHRYR